MATAHVLVGAGTQAVQPVRRITPADLLQALRCGLDDFAAMPSHAVFLCIIYPLLGIMLVSLTFGYTMLPLLFPLAAGFALIGPIAAIGLYELSRRREAGLDTASTHALDVLRSRSLGAIVALGILLMAIFLVWLAVAQAIYVAYFGYAAPVSIRQFIDDVLFTPAGWGLIIVGTGVGFLFAALVLTISVVSFPLLLDRDVGAAVRAAHVRARGRGEPGHYGAVGIDRRRLVAGRIAALLPRPHRSHAGARPFDLASLSAGGGARSGLASGFPSGAHELSFRRGFPVRPVHAARIARPRPLICRPRSVAAAGTMPAFAGTKPAGIRFVST